MNKGVLEERYHGTDNRGVEGWMDEEEGVLIEEGMEGRMQR